MSPEQLQARVLYRDGLMLIIDKPAGLPCHAGPKGGPNLEAQFDALRFGLPKPPALAHRLDRDTSGCLVLGRHRKALAKLGRLFSSGGIDKTYWAIVSGGPAEDAGHIDRPLSKLNKKSGWKMVVDPQGQPSQTDFRVLGRSEGICWLELKPLTGRTHQLRIHCSSMGWPILGDPVYGPVPGDTGGVPLHLHARAVSVPLYPKRDAVSVTAEPPAHMLKALRACGYTE
ncbi:RluA family pseudouridine synthase [Oceanibaculum sp.]|uniref:RluA family pseudouridine synthase n=1 Tax=Oceanibaculum sp. TaxID=1903597 RepID=UPI0025829179|nr:RNA pseudouridine synthase [Oceanibaculum sp.]MCH2394485.1 RNA pseudouridine synthase [Oceanibaculum sp.]